MPVRTRTAIAAVSLAAVALVGGCSSSNSDSSSSATTVAAAPATTTKAAFVAAATATCNEWNAKMATAGGNADSLTAAVPGLEQQAEVLSGTIDALKALPQPTGADAPTELFASIEKVQGTLQQLITAAKADDTAQAEQLSNQIDQETTAANQVWDAYGISTCGSASSQNQNQNQNQNQQNQNQNQQNQNQSQQNQQQQGQNQNQNDQQQNR